MQYTKTGIKDFNLAHIFECGQCFRWERQNDGSYTGTAMGKIVNMRFEPEGTLTVDNCTEEEFMQIWTPYLDLERDYAKIKSGLKGEQIQKAVEYGYGIRILKQDFWETLLSFIISQNNNIPRIKDCIEALTHLCGTKIGTYKGKDYYAMPEPEVLAGMTPDELAECRLGYRGPYLIKTAQKVLEKGGALAAEKELRNCETFEEAQAALREYPGVGPKVASCTALFGLGFPDAFPIDVWMRRVMHRLYGMDEKDVRGMEDFAKKNFAPYGGIAQQYLFYYIRGLH